MLEAPGFALIDSRDNYVTQDQKSNYRRNHEKSDLAQAGIETSTENARYFAGFADGTAHHRQFGSGNGHAKKTYGQGVECLGVSEAGNCPRHPACKERINVRADLDNAAADKHRKEIADNGLHVFRLM